ncbi:MAG: alpha/beta hydrolase [Chloroflexaceae bacterium]|nr:alpha/beta hydrolase [Chloroflexaceae bacterium]NJO07862.1 alpha/beta hydrolase [Chloroflexaceae bacterium]
MTARRSIPRWGRRIGMIIGGCIVLLLLLLIGLMFLPISTSGLDSTPEPVADYDAALARIEQMQASEPAAVRAECRTRLLNHGAPTEHVIVLLHGKTNCPAQFAVLSEVLYEQGYNVFVPRLPHHGLTNTMTDDLKNLTAEELAAFGDAVVDSAVGLGDTITVAGLSAGGVVSAWIAQHRSDVDRAVLIAPAFSTGRVPTALAMPVMRLALRIPDQQFWIDAQRQEDWPGPPHNYKRQSSRGFAELARLGVAVRQAAEQAPPQTRAIVLVNNANDRAVDTTITGWVIEAWEAQGGNVQVAEIPAELGLDHDMIDPLHPNEKVDVAYPILLDLIAPTVATHHRAGEQ